MAVPLAGSMKMPLARFLGFDFPGRLAYALSYGAVGFFFRDFVGKIVSGFRAAGHAVEAVIIIAVFVTSPSHFPCTGNTAPIASCREYRYRSWRQN